MILKTYLWKKPGDEDYVAPKIQLINKDLLSSNKIKPNGIIEVVSLKDKTILVQYRHTEDEVQLQVVYYKKKPKNLIFLAPLDSNQKFDS
jgi:hypothetical protein